MFLNIDNKGNFQELCYLISKFDLNFSNMFLNTIFNFGSKIIQNELIHIIANKVSITISNKIKNVGFYTILADEAKTHKEELIAICVRYTQGLKIRESFLEFMNCSEARNAIGLYSKIKQINCCT